MSLFPLNILKYDFEKEIGERLVWHINDQVVDLLLVLLHSD